MSKFHVLIYNMLFIPWVNARFLAWSETHCTLHQLTKYCHRERNVVVSCHLWGDCFGKVRLAMTLEMFKMN
ncbi:MAG TPA: hypothetical protein VIJ25_10020, partial [Methylococcales bacterium]